jgi:glycosyltransferase involved in cell wall biosynthesis
VRVLMVSKACVVGVYQTKLEELARFSDLELTVVVPPYWRDVGGVIPLERLHTTGYELVVEPIALNGNFHLHFYPGLGGQVRRVKPELVHIDEEPYNLATAHALWLARRTGSKSLFFSWQNIQRRYPVPFRLLERYVLNRAEYGIAGSDESAGVWRAKGYTRPIAVIPQFGVDPELFHPAAVRRQGESLVVGFVGRLVKEKGVDLLLEALDGLPDSCRAQVAGSGPDEDRLRTLIQKLGLEGKVTLAGKIPAAHMPEFYRQLDVLVLPSRTRQNWKEQFGRVLVEAMACGVPVIGSDSGEIPNVVGDAGLIFAEGQVDALRSCLAQLVDKPELRASLGRKGRDRVLAHFTQSQIAARTHQVYRSVLGA